MLPRACMGFITLVRRALHDNPRPHGITNTGAGYKAVTIATMDLQLCMEIILTKNNNFFVNPFSSDAQYIIMQVITTYIHYSAGADELANLHENRFLSRRTSSLS